MPSNNTKWILAALALSLAGACKKSSPAVITAADAEEEPPRWHFERVQHELGDGTLTGVWARSDGAVVAVGWNGMIATNRVTAANPDGLWVKMPSPTTENLTAVIGLENGERFAMPAADGEMFAVGWHGTVLHYHPNPDGDPATEDGGWQLVAGPGAGSFTVRLRVDPACPDYDGDGVADDGDGDGYWGNAICVAGQADLCDDNCRTAANGNQRPWEDRNIDGCIGPGDGPAPATEMQRDDDGDGFGLTCDPDDLVAEPRPGLDSALFAVTARFDNDTLRVVAVGADGVVLTYNGADATLGPSVIDPRAWIAEQQLAFRFGNDCPVDTPAGQACTGSGRLPPACPAQCHPRRTACDCPADQGRCCDPAAPTGSGCVDGSCGPAANACVGGECSTLCPGCFRRLEQTLRAVALDGDTILAAGADGTVVIGAVTVASGPGDPWNAPTCVPTPKPLDERPVLTAAAVANGAFTLVGADGAVVRYPGGACPLGPIEGAPPAFLSGVVATAADVAYIVGDRGTVLELRGGAIEALPMIEEETITENLLAVAVTYAGGEERLWLVGAGGTIVRAGFY